MNVYILQGSIPHNDKFLYVGLTSDLDNGLSSHFSGGSATTSKMGQLKLRHVWNVPDYISASKLKRYLHRKPDKDLAYIVLKHRLWNEDLARVVSKLPTSDFEIQQASRHAN